MKLTHFFDRAIVLMIIVTAAAVFGCLLSGTSVEAEVMAAEEEEFLETTETSSESDVKFVTVYDDGEKTIIRTDAETVEEIISRMGVELTDGDKVEPALDTEIDTDNFFINIYRARPAVVIDGVTRKYLMTASYDARTIAEEAGITMYDGDEIALTKNEGFLESGVANVYEITRSGGEEEAITTEEEIVLHNQVTLPETTPKWQKLTATMGVNRYTVEINGVIVMRKETYYDLPMAGVMGFCGGGDYTVREDGAKVDKDGYVLVAANLDRYPRCSVVETSLGLGKVYDTGGFAVNNPEQFDLATDWTDRNGR